MSKILRNQRLLIQMTKRLRKTHDTPVSVYLSPDRPSKNAFITFRVPVEGLNADVAPQIEETLRDTYEILLYELSGNAAEEE